MSGTQKETKSASSLIHFIAGGTGAMAGAVFTCPLDVVKTRLQSDLYNSQKVHVGSRNPLMKGWHHVAETFGILVNVYKVEGARSLFKGLGPNLVGVVPARSINFVTYSKGKEYIANTFNNGREETWVHLLAAANAGIITSTATNPIWLIKTRLQLDKSSKAAERKYTSSLDCLIKTVRGEGIPGLYKGLTASYLGVAESSIQWVLYEKMKGIIQRASDYEIRNGNTPSPVLQWLATSGSAGAAKLFASIITYPHEVVRTRLRQAPLENGRPKYSGLINCIITVIKEEGLLSMYGGMTPHLLRTVPNTIIMFGTWELVVKLLSQ